MDAVVILHTLLYSVTLSFSNYLFVIYLNAVYFATFDEKFHIVPFPLQLKHSS